MLYFLNLFFDSQTVYRASPCQISWQSVKPLLRYGDSSIFFKMAPSSIFNLWYSCLDNPQRVLDGLYRCAKFGWSLLCSFGDMCFIWECNNLGFTSNEPKSVKIGSTVWPLKVSKIRVTIRKTRNRKHRRAAAKPAACAKPLLLSRLGRGRGREGYI